MMALFVAAGMTWSSVAFAAPASELPNQTSPAEDRVDPGNETAALATLPPPPGVKPSVEAIEALTHDVASGLRCPVCQGLSVADSPSKTAVTMKHRVEELVADGYTKPQIEAYFVARYGEWVLLQPTFSENWLVWLAPAALGAAGLVLVGRTLRRSARTPSGPVPASPSTAAHEKATDPYAERLLREIDE